MLSQSVDPDRQSDLRHPSAISMAELLPSANLVNFGANAGTLANFWLHHHVDTLAEAAPSFSETDLEHNFCTLRRLPCLDIPWIADTHTVELPACTLPIGHFMHSCPFSELNIQDTFLTVGCP